MQQLSQDEQVYNCITQKLLHRNCTRVACMKNYCQGEGLMVAFARNLGDLPCAALDLHLRVIAGGDWASLPPASAKKGGTAKHKMERKTIGHKIRQGEKEKEK